MPVEAGIEDEDEAFSTPALQQPDETQPDVSPQAAKEPEQEEPPIATDAAPEPEEANAAEVPDEPSSEGNDVGAEAELQSEVQQFADVEQPEQSKDQDEASDTDADTAPDNEHPDTVPDDEPEAIQQPLSVDLPARPSIDDSLLAVLREEAEREASARRSEDVQKMETQTDLGLDNMAAAAGMAGGAKSRLSRLRGEDDDLETEERPPARRDLLPDIEEINSTLRASSETRNGDDDDVPAMPKPRSGFRSGFVLMLVLGAILIGVYLGAPRIAQHLPGTAGPLATYVSVVDSVRSGLDVLMQTATKSLQGMTSGDQN